MEETLNINGHWYHFNGKKICEEWKSLFPSSVGIVDEGW